MDTIIALSSGALPAGIAVIRVSGPEADALAMAFCGDLPEPRMAALRVLRDPDGLEIDRGLVIRFPGSASFTGESIVEFQLHGGRAVVDRVLDLATADPAIRLAEPGEFARRAFANGRLDLTEAEGLADLISAETEAQRRFAVDQAAGAHGDLYGRWRAQLLQARAMIEAEIDFSDEEDVPGSVSTTVWRDVAALSDSVAKHLAAEKRGTILRSGLRIALIGPPNAGKSTLLNVLAGSDRAIVSPEPGTTRDVVEARLDLDGYLVIIADTAGLRRDAGAVEREGMRRARLAAQAAHLVLQLDETGRFDPLVEDTAGPIWRIGTKSDLFEGASPVAADFVISARKGFGMDELMAALAEFVRRQAGQGGDPAPSRARHVGHLRAASEALTRARDGALAVELRAEELRIAGDELGRIIGVIAVEEMLGRIFSTFCIGK